MPSSSGEFQKFLQAFILMCSRPERWANYSDTTHAFPGVYANMLTFLGGPRQVSSKQQATIT